MCVASYYTFEQDFIRYDRSGVHECSSEFDVKRRSGSRLSVFYK